MNDIIDQLTYMICMLFALTVQAYANNQHKIAEEMLTNPFLKAMSICKGTVSMRSLLTNMVYL